MKTQEKFTLDLQKTKYQMAMELWSGKMGAITLANGSMGWEMDLESSTILVFGLIHDGKMERALKDFGAMTWKMELAFTIILQTVNFSNMKEPTK